MTAITQTIPNYVGGISEQPDQLKVPGQVKDLQNAIPDMVHGLYKRPGAKRIGRMPIENVQSGGSWFHYYRDETEGSYIGQVASDGKVRMWCCKDLFNASGTKVNSAGDEIFVHYGAVSGAYTQSNYDGSNSTHTAIKSYLTPDPSTDTEDIQALTINDTTFLNNRSKVVTTTGTTDSRPHKNFAYIELLRTENGRQYGLNIYDNDTTTTINRATRISINSDDLAEGDGTGTCPGIGTQVFSVTKGSGTGADSANAKNLIFRITTLGQQGRKSSSSTDVTGDDYRCSYNRELTLLHGGEGWDTNDTTGNVALTSAASTYNYDIKVVDHEASVVKANIKAVRPAPTPFDADTAVTVDTVLGSIAGELSGVTVNGNALNYKIIGNGIYLYTADDADDFNVEVVDQDLMRVMQTQVNDVTNLPIQCKHGLIVKVSNTRMSDEDDYYVKFVGENNQDGSGSWVECPAPGIVKSFNADTMPHVLQRQPISGSNPVIFLAKKFEWADREIGDDITNQAPSFCGASNGATPAVYAQDVKINKIMFFRNRLAFLAGENVILCRPGSLAKPNFWSDSALTVSAIDPIDISCASNYPSELFDAIEINTGLLCFSTNQQFLLSSDDTMLNPDTVKLRTVSMYNYHKIIPPISLGQTVGYVDNTNKYSRFMEMANVVREGAPVVVNTSEIVPTLIPKDVDLITNSRENKLVFFGKTDEDEVTVFRYLNQGEKRLQSSWFKWKFNNPLKYHFCIEDTYYFVDSDNFLQSINIIQSDTDPSIVQDNEDYLIHLDNFGTVSGGRYDPATDLTTFTHDDNGCDILWARYVTTPNGNLVVVDVDTDTSRVGRYANVTMASDNLSFTLPGIWHQATLYIGYLYDYQVDFPRIYLQKMEGETVRSDINSRLTVHRIKLNFGKIGLYDTTLTRKGKAAYNDIYESTDLDEYDASDAPYLAEKIKDIPVYEKNVNLDIQLKSSHPAPATLRSMSWEGDFSSMHYQRV